jgi:23S rRNA (adenine2503-C2)-methyltransferase
VKNKDRSLFSLTLDQLRSELVAAGFTKFSADQVYHWLYKQMNFDVESWSNVSKKVKAYIGENYSLELPRVIWDGLSKDGTRKFLLRLDGGDTVESVVIAAPGRLTLCVSSQVGCAIGCTFCHTGTMGFKRHLSPGEIVGQLVGITSWLRKETSDSELRISNMVYMGQGEPLHNYEAVKTATHIFMEEKGLGYGQRKITLSTSGLVPQIEKLWDFPPINVAISLHAAHDKIRTELMPINKVYDLRKLFEAIKTIPLKAHRRITYEYLLIDGLNDRQEDLDGLCDLLDKKESKVNLIPFNEYPESSFKRPSNNKINWFMKSLNDRGIVCTVRATKGEDILAACGQLKSLKDSEPNVWA